MFENSGISDGDPAQKTSYFGTSPPTGVLREKVAKRFSAVVPSSVMQSYNEYESVPTIQGISSEDGIDGVVDCPLSEYLLAGMGKPNQLTTP